MTRRPSLLITRSLMLIALTAVPFAAMAQNATATLSGTVVDPNGAVVPGANITLTEAGTGLQRAAATNDQGQFTIPLLKPSTYTLLIAHEGFTTAEVRDVVLNVNDNRALRIPLKTGDINETVNITGEAPLINESPAVGTVVDRKFVENIPLNGRSFQSLILLTPGVVAVPSGTANFGGQFSVNGQRASANGFTVDGVSANFGAAPGLFGGSQTSGNLPGLTALGTTHSLVSVDALQEFKVQTSTYAAEYGRQPGGQISIATRSGTNQFHGSAFDYVRNDVFDANDWFANANRQGKSPERQNDFGGTFGGPVFFPRFGEGGRQIYKGQNRTFFFFSYEGMRVRLPQFNLTNVPDLCLRGQGTCPAGQSAAAVAVLPILNAFPLPNGRILGNGLAEFSSGYSDPSSLDATSIRVDHTISNRLTIFGRFNNSPSQTSTRRVNQMLSLNQVRNLETRTTTVGLTALLTSQISNDLRFNYSSNGAYIAFRLDDFGGAVPPPRSSVIASQYDQPAARSTITFNLSGFTSVSAPLLSTNDRFTTNQNQLNLVDTLSYTRGSHQFKFGIDYRRLTPRNESFIYSFGATFTSRTQLVTGVAPTGSAVSNIETHPVFTNFSAFAQDTWKLSRRTTLDFGVRWEVNPAPSEANGNNQLAVDQISDLSTMQLAPLGTNVWKTTYNNFAPRFGVAYQIRQAPGHEMVVRGGFGVFYDTGNDSGAINFANGYPFQVTRSLTNVVFPLSSVQVAPLSPPISNPTPPYGRLSVFDPNLELPYTLQWNLAMEQSLGKSQVFTLSYVGAAGRRLLQNTQVALNTVNAVTMRPINPNFTTVLVTTNSARSNYHALQAQFQRRLSHRVQALASYTWSHALDEDSGSTTGRVAQYGNADFDVRQLFAAAATYDVPVLSKDRLATAVTGGWSIDTTIHAQSAFPVDIVARTFTDPATGDLINVRPNLLTGVPVYTDDPASPGGRRINRAAFSVPATGQFGNLGRNIVRGLPAWQVDFALRRQFKLWENLGLQLRAEAFNIFNHPNFSGIQTNLGTAAPPLGNFGQATSMLNRQLGGISQLYQIGGPRSFQFAMKILF